MLSMVLSASRTRITVSRAHDAFLDWSICIGREAWGVLGRLMELPMTKDKVRKRASRDRAGGTRDRRTTMSYTKAHRTDPTAPRGTTGRAPHAATQPDRGVPRRSRAAVPIGRPAPASDRPRTLQLRRAALAGRPGRRMRGLPRLLFGATPRDADQAERPSQAGRSTWECNR